MNIKVKTAKDITPAIRKEMVWIELSRVQDIISYLYQDKSGACWKFDDPKMQKIYYDLNTMCMSLSEDGDMDWQLKEKQNEHTDNA